MDFPLIYCNGDSHCDPNFYYPAMVGHTYADYVGAHFNGFVINKSKTGSCNRRIVRTAVHDLMVQRQANPTQPIMALIAFAQEHQDEFWVDGRTPNDPEDSNFVGHSLISNFDNAQIFQDDEVTLRFGDQESRIPAHLVRDWSQGNTGFYNAYARRIDFLHDVLMMTVLLERLQIQAVCFQITPRERLVNEYLIDFYKNKINPDTVLDIESFGFATWCGQQGFDPLLDHESPDQAHYGADAHRAFANNVLIPKLRCQ